MKIIKILFSLLIAIVTLLPQTAHAWSLNVYQPYSATCTQKLHGSYSAFDFQDYSGSTTYFRAGITSPYRVRGLVDSGYISSLALYDRNGNYSHTERIFRVDVYWSQSTGTIWNRVGSVRYVHQSHTGGVSTNTWLNHGSSVCRNSTSHTGVGPWYYDTTQTKLASTGAHLHFERYTVTPGYTTWTATLNSGIYYSNNNVLYTWHN